MNKEYADIRYSQELAEFFPDAEWWWSWRNRVTSKSKRTFMKGYLLYSKEEISIDKFRYKDMHHYPTITIQMALDVLKKGLKEKFRLNLEDINANYLCKMIIQLRDEGLIKPPKEGE